ncbi:MAG: hypothetical protein K2I14_02820 [Eubacterium sp.]|nr:hypothetical protein [Eubacterium sp.]
MENKKDLLFPSVLDIEDKIYAVNIETEKAEYIIYTLSDIAAEANAAGDVGKLIQFYSIQTLIEIAADYLSKIKKEAANLKKDYACLANLVKKTAESK